LNSSPSLNANISTSHKESLILKAKCQHYKYRRIQGGKLRKLSRERATDALLERHLACLDCGNQFRRVKSTLLKKNCDNSFELSTANQHSPSKQEKVTSMDKSDVLDLASWLNSRKVEPARLLQSDDEDWRSGVGIFYKLKQ
jgi:hypothetical protein